MPQPAARRSSKSSHRSTRPARACPIWLLGPVTLRVPTRPQLMEMPSLARSPVAPVLLSRSEPAKSTKWNLAVSVSYSVPVGAAPSGSPVTVSFTCSRM